MQLQWQSCCIYVFLHVTVISSNMKPVLYVCCTVLQSRGVAVNFDNTASVLEALQSGVVLVDQSHWGRIRVSGDDAISFMHNQTTNDFQCLQPGQGCDTVCVCSAWADGLATYHVPACSMATQQGNAIQLYTTRFTSNKLSDLFLGCVDCNTAFVVSC